MQRFDPTRDARGLNGPTVLEWEDADDAADAGDAAGAIGPPDANDVDDDRVDDDGDVVCVPRDAWLDLARWRPPLPPPWWRRPPHWRRRKPPPRGHHRPPRPRRPGARPRPKPHDRRWRGVAARRRAALRRPDVRRPGRLVRGARRPVFRTRSPRGRSMRMVARPRGRRLELASLGSEPGRLQGETNAGSRAGSARRPARPVGRTPDGTRLRLSHRALHATLARLRPHDLRRLCGGRLPADPEAAVARSVAWLTARARPVGRMRAATGETLPVYGARGYRMLVRPSGAGRGEILLVRPEREEEGFLGEVRRSGGRRGGRGAGGTGPRPLSGRRKDALRRAATAAFRKAYPRMRKQRVEVHHRVPLEWSHLFARANPNRLSNLQGLATRDHRRKASDLWDAFRNTYRRLGREPTRTEVLRFAGLVDRSLLLPYPL